MAYELTDEEWSRLRELLPQSKQGRHCLDLRRTLSGIKGANACIPCKKTYKIKWEIDRKQYKKRNVVERFFQRLKENRRSAL